MDVIPRLVLIVENIVLQGAGNNGLAVAVDRECSVLMKQAPWALGACQLGEAIGRSRGPGR